MDIYLILLGQTQLLRVPLWIGHCHLHRGSLEITLTVPLKGLNIFNQRETFIFPLSVLYSVLGKNSTRHIHVHPFIQTLVSLFEH